MKALALVLLVGCGSTTIEYIQAPAARGLASTSTRRPTCSGVSAVRLGS